MFEKPRYSVHRKWGDGAAAVAADSTTLSVIKALAERGHISAKGLETIEATVHFTGGTTPALTVQPYELMELEDNTKDLVKAGPAIGPVYDGQKFSVPTPGGGLIFLSVPSFTGSPTACVVRVAMGLKAPL